MTYLQGDHPLPEGCLFCVESQAENTQAHIVHRDQLCYVILNRFPYNNGHLMIVPYAHASSLEYLDDKALAEMMRLTQLSLRVLRKAYNPQGFNVGLNIGEAAGAGIAGHVHLHIVPRWNGDMNAMSVIGQTRVIPEWLDQTFERLRPLFKQLSALDI